MKGGSRVVLMAFCLQVNKTGDFVGLSDLYFLWDEVNKINRGFVYLDGRGCRPGFPMSADIRGSAATEPSPDTPAVWQRSRVRVCCRFRAYQHAILKTKPTRSAPRGGRRGRDSRGAARTPPRSPVGRAGRPPKGAPMPQGSDWPTAHSQPHKGGHRFFVRGGGLWVCGRESGGRSYLI